MMYIRTEDYFDWRPCGRNWAVYHYKRTATGYIGTKIGEYLTKEEAKRKAYELCNSKIEEEKYGTSIL